MSILNLVVLQIKIVSKMPKHNLRWCICCISLKSHKIMSFLCLVGFCGWTDKTLLLCIHSISDSFSFSFCVCVFVLFAFGIFVFLPLPHRSTSFDYIILIFLSTIFYFICIPFFLSFFPFSSFLTRNTKQAFFLSFFLFDFISFFFSFFFPSYFSIFFTSLFISFFVLSFFLFIFTIRNPKQLLYLLSFSLSFFLSFYLSFFLSFFSHDKHNTNVFMSKKLSRWLHIKAAHKSFAWVGLSISIRSGGRQEEENLLPTTIRREMVVYYPPWFEIFAKLIEFFHRKWPFVKSLLILSYVIICYHFVVC